MVEHSPLEYLEFLLEMKERAKEARSRRRRIHYTPEQQEMALELLTWVEERRGTLEDAAELMSMHRSTLLGWLNRATAPPPARARIIKISVEAEVG